jgi:hypothetical protein
MNYLTNYKLFESSDNVQFSEENGKLVVIIDNKKYLYQITVVTSLVDLDVDLDKIVKQLDGSFQITASTNTLKQKTFLSKSRAQKIINDIKTQVDKTGKPPKEITSKKEQSSQKTFTLTLV